MSNKDNKQVVQEFFERVLNERDPYKIGDAVSELVDSNHVFRTPNPKEEKRGSAMLTAVVEMLRTISPDLQVEFDEKEMIAEGDIVLCPWTASGTVSDKLKRARATNDEVKGVKATDDEVTLSAISVFRISERKIKETWQLLEARQDQTPSPAIQSVLAENPRIKALEPFDWCCRIWPRCCRR